MDASAMSTDDSSVSSPGSSDWSFEASSLDGSDLSEVELVAWIDVLTPSYAVLHETPDFAGFVDAKGELLAAIRPSQREHFVGWVQQAWLSLLQDSSSAPLRHHERICFSSHAQQNGGTARPAVISAFPALDLMQPPDGQDHGNGVVRIVLKGCKLGRGAPRGHRRRGTPQSTPEAASGRLLGQQPSGAVADGAAQLEGRSEARASSRQPRPPGPVGSSQISNDVIVSTAAGSSSNPAPSRPMDPLPFRVVL